MDPTELIDLPLHMVGFVSWCATWLVALVVIARGDGSRQSIGALAAIYLLLGLDAVLAIGSVSGQHYSYSDVSVNGELLPADDEWLLWHAGVSIGYAALVWRSRTWPLGTPFSSAWFVLAPIVAELLLRPRHWAWLLLGENGGIGPSRADPPVRNVRGCRNAGPRFFCSDAYHGAGALARSRERDSPCLTCGCTRRRPGEPVVA
jgi:hypothetical protein